MVFNFPTDAKGRDGAAAEIRATAEKIRLLREEEHFEEQLDATAKGSKDREIAALLAKVGRYTCTNTHTPHAYYCRLQCTTTQFMSAAVSQLEGKTTL